jgi:rubrerythrin
VADEDLADLKRPRLDEIAEADGVPDPQKLPNKQAVIDAIHEARANDGRAVPDERPAGRTLEIVKVNDRGDWWCPHCDHSMNSKERHCPNCLAERDGEKAVRP